MVDMCFYGGIVVSVEEMRYNWFSLEGYFVFVESLYFLLSREFNKKFKGGL